MGFYIGIDGGGTKTRCLLGNGSEVLATAMSGGCNIVRLGEASARESLLAVLRQVCAFAKISPEQIDAICIGAAGAARPEIAAKLRSILTEAEIRTSARVEITTDAAIALEAAFGAGPGVIAIAGTGSIVYG
ncbi:MAG: BadF/BadG/BcrA/BcrD ATPase family protein, partial [Terriglobales bacterium]